jgi:DNA-binding transcriptional MerR regulator
MKKMFEKFSSEDLKNIIEIINFMKETGVDIESISKAREVKSDKIKEPDTIVNKEEEILKKMKEFQDVAWNEEADKKWEKVLENRKNNPELRWMKHEGKKATIEDLDNILKKLKGEE